MLALAASLLLAASFPEQLTKPLPGSISKDKSWTWPQKNDFEEAWKKRQEAGTSFPLLTGDLEAENCSVKGWTLREHVDEAGGRMLSAVMESQDANAWCSGWSWQVVKQEGDVYELKVRETVARFTARSRQAPRAVPEQYLTDWTYAATLLSPKPAGAKLLQEYKDNVPMGHCSMDTGPQDFAKDFADRCFKQGELACFLQLQVRVMGDQFDRVAWSSYGEASHPTEAGRLETTGIDVDRFFRGLVMMLPGNRPSELGPSRLSRALLESGRRAKFEPLLLAMAQDDALDDYDRFRAFATWASLYFRSDEKAKLDPQVAKLKLDALSKRWWSQLK